jgi:hypothetical protein
MFDRDPIMNWVHGRIALLGGAAHPPLQYMAQGAIMAIEDGWVLAEHVGRQLVSGVGVADLDWDVALSAYNAVRPEHCRRVLTTGRVWGELWHLDDTKRLQRNAILRARDTYDYTFTEWIYGNTALFPRTSRRCTPPARSTRSTSPASRRRRHGSSSQWSDSLFPRIPIRISSRVRLHRLWSTRHRPQPAGPPTPSETCRPWSPLPVRPACLPGQ